MLCRKNSHSRRLLCLLLLLTAAPTLAQAARRPARRLAAPPAAPAAPQPDSVAEMLRTGAQLLSQGHPERAIPLLAEAVVRDPKQSRALLYLGLCHLQLGHAQQAMSLFERFQDESGTFLDKEAMEQLRGYYEDLASKLAATQAAEPGKPELLLLSGRAHFRAGQLDKAGAMYRSYRQAAPKGQDGPLQKLHDDYLREYHEAVVRRERARLSEPGAGPETYLSLGEAYLGLGEDEEAVDAFDAYREVAGISGPGKLRLGAGYRALVKKLDERVGPALLVSARAHFGLGHLKEAEERYGRYRRDNPAPPLAFRERLARYQREQETERLSAEARRPKPIYKKWWFWTALGAGAAGTATAIAVGVTQTPSADPLDGIPGNNRRTVMFP